MPADDPEMKLVEDRLRALIDCVLAQALKTPELASQLKQVFLSDSLRLAVKSKSGKVSRRVIFNPTDYLATHTVDALRQELSDKTTHELMEIARKNKILTTKAVKDMPREDIITTLVAFAEQKLNQGNAFLRSNIQFGESLTSPPPTD